MDWRIGDAALAVVRLFLHTFFSGAGSAAKACEDNEGLREDGLSAAVAARDSHGNLWAASAITTWL